MVGEDAELVVQTEFEEKGLTIGVNSTPESARADTIKREVTKFLRARR